jgi:hypothetical protein
MADNDQLLGEDVNLDNNSDAGGQGSHQEPDYLDMLVGDGKKYADDKNLAKGYANLQAHTNTILDEKTALQKENEVLKSTNKTVEDVLAAINGNPDGGGGNHDFDNHDQNNANQKLSKEDIVSLITGALDKRDEDKETRAEVDRIKANQKVTWEKLSEVYGDKEKAKAVVTMYVNNDNKKKELVQNLGSYDPTTLVEIIKVAVPSKGEQVDFGLGDLTKENTKETLPTPKGLFTYAEAEVVRKKNPVLYKTRDFQLRLHKSAAEHPRFWEGTNRRK